MAEFMFQNVVYRATVYRTGTLQLLEVKTIETHALTFLSHIILAPAGVLDWNSSQLHNIYVFQNNV